ncbi:hypothetical protein ACFWBC_36625 [Streptomyces sp. NPDC059985]|uniref:hypothetical protein n=1 Tax=Streptomyces sp. NPDC059985 TaxID=3347025 RepID=UPI0036A67C8C
MASHAPAAPAASVPQGFEGFGGAADLFAAVTRSLDPTAGPIAIPAAPVAVPQTAPLPCPTRPVDPRENG